MFKSIWDDIVYEFKRRNVTMILIWICVVVFLIFEFIRLAYWSNNHELFYYEQVYKRFALPMSFSRILYQPWSLISFMFIKCHKPYPRSYQRFGCFRVSCLKTRDTPLRPILRMASPIGPPLRYLQYDRGINPTADCRVSCRSLWRARPTSTRYQSRLNSANHQASKTSPFPRSS